MYSLCFALTGIIEHPVGTIINCTSYDPTFLTSDGLPMYCCNTLNWCCHNKNLLFTLADYNDTLAISPSLLVTTVTALTVTETVASPASRTSLEHISSTASLPPATPTETGHVLPSDHTGLEVGLSLGLGIPLLAALVTCAMFWRRKQNRSQDKTQGMDRKPSPDPVPTIQSTPIPPYMAPKTHVELQSHDRTELDSNSRTELDSRTGPIELAGSDS